MIAMKWFSEFKEPQRVPEPQGMPKEKKKGVPGHRRFSYLTRNPIKPFWEVREAGEDRKFRRPGESYEQSDLINRILRHWRTGGNPESGNLGRETAGLGGISGNPESIRAYDELPPEGRYSTKISRAAAGRVINVITVGGVRREFVLDDGTLYGWRTWQAQPHPPSARVARPRPAVLLGGVAAVTDFVDRKRELARLRSWFNSPDRMSVMLVYGPGGQGKTRLVRHFADTMSQHQEKARVYEAFPLLEAQKTEGQIEEDDQNDAAPTSVLLVVDEADRWPTDKLLTLFRDAKGKQSERLRVLMTSRASDMWWDELCAKLELDPLGFTCHKLPLRPLDAAGTRELAQAAHRAFAAALDTPPPPLRPEVVDGLVGSPPLSLELMVLGSTVAHVSGQQPPNDVRMAIRMLLDKELLYWRDMSNMSASGGGEDPNRIQLKQKFMKRVVYIATLVGPLGYITAQGVVKLARIGCNMDMQQIIDDHARCYPPTDDNYRLAPLAPCLAEEFLGVLVPDSECDDDRRLVDAWATATPFHILGLTQPPELEAGAFEHQMTAAAGAKSPRPAAARSQDYTFLPVMAPPTVRSLVRAAATWPHLAKRQLYPLARHYPKAVVMAGDDVMAELRKLRPAPPDDVLQVLDKTTKEYYPADLADYRKAIEALQQLATGYAEQTRSGQGEVHMSIHIGGDVVNSNVVAADTISRSSLTVASTTVPEDLRATLIELHKAVATLTLALPDDEAELAARDLEDLTREATSSRRPAFLRRAADGLLAAAGKVAQVGIPVAELVAKIMALV